MIESRCGMLCTECQFRLEPGCNGCTNITKPFWGEACPLKDCCEGKNLEHCGLCTDFPCSLLHQFAYDAVQGDGGKRILQCAAWANK